MKITLKNGEVIETNKIADATIRYALNAIIVYNSSINIIDSENNKRIIEIKEIEKVEPN